MAKRNLRADAAKAVFQVLENGQSLREIMPDVTAGHSGKDVAWLQEMVFGVLRHLPQLQQWLRLLLEKPLKGKQAIIEHLILVGFYQLAFTRVSTHAAVAETVEGAVSLKSPRLKGVVNGVLRNFIRQQLADKQSNDPRIVAGLPNWLYKSLSEHYSVDQFQQLTLSMQKKAPLWLRVNTRELSVATYVGHLEAENIPYELPDTHRDGILLKTGCDITRLPGFSEGWFTVQDGAAQLAADYMPTEKNQRVLDACAAPGGKTTHLLQRQNNQLHCTALDIEPERMIRTKENLARLKLNADVLIGDATQKEPWWDGQLYDHILLDAPCSATGVIRRHPDIKWHRKAKDIEVLVDLQSRILDNLWQTLKPGGSLLYATCSILPQENHQQIDAFLARTKDAQATALGPDMPESRRQILPGESSMDGFFYAKLTKIAPKV